MLYDRMECIEVRQETVLVVEDEVFIRMSTVASLEDAGFCVLEAKDSADALELLADHAEISVLVTDVRMPGCMDGLGLVARVRHDYPAIRAIVISGNASADDAYKAGAAGFISKPYLSHRVALAVLNLPPHNPAPLGFAA